MKNDTIDSQLINVITRAVIIVAFILIRITIK